MRGFESATVVLDNPPAEGAVFSTQRVSHERYVSYMPSLVPEEPFLVIPVKVLDKALVRIGGPQLPVGTRVAWTAYTDVKIPDGNILWQQEKKK